MADRDFPDLNGRELDALLEQDLSALPPPPEVTGKINPWRDAMDRVIVGLGLATVTVNLLWLDYLLPLCGTVMQYLGFRTLRRENRWFGAGWVLAGVRLVYTLAHLCLNAAVLPSPISGGAALAISTGVYVQAVLTALCLWRGIRSVQRRAGLPPHAGSAAALMVWYVILYLLGLADYSGWTLILPILVCYALIIHALYRLSSALDQAGYAVRAAPVRVPDSRIKWLCFWVLLAGLLLGYLAFDRYPMDWSPVDAAAQAEQQEVRDHLLALGFPGEVLDSLTAEDLAACAGALRVAVDMDDAYDGRLQVTGVAVELPGARGHWKIFHYFVWSGPPRWMGTQAVLLYPASYHNGWQFVGGSVSGRVLFDRQGQSYAAPCFSAAETDYQSGWFSAVQDRTAPVFAFSFPRRGAHFRGYVSYEALVSKDDYLIDSWFNYYFQTGRLQYPVRTARDRALSGSIWPSSSSPMERIQCALQIHILPDGSADRLE